jgi:hypothetical protein
VLPTISCQIQQVSACLRQLPPLTVDRRCACQFLSVLSQVLKVSQVLKQPNLVRQLRGTHLSSHCHLLHCDLSLFSLFLSVAACSL